MLNRAFQVKMVKTKKKDSTEDVPEDDYAEKVAYASAAAQDVIREGTRLVAVYIVMDTFRKIAIAIAKK